MIRTTLSMMAFATLGVTGCYSDQPQQALTGRIATTTFPEGVTDVRAVGNLATVSAKVAADGSFSLALPANDRYRIEVVSPSRVAELVFARTGAVGASFFVADASTAFELGNVVYAKDADHGVTPGGDTGTHSGGDTGTHSGGDTGTHACGDANEPEGTHTNGDGARPDHSPPDTLGCSGDSGSGGGGDTGTGGGADTGTGGGGS